MISVAWNKLDEIFDENDVRNPNVVINSEYRYINTKDIGFIFPCELVGKCMSSEGALSCRVILYRVYFKAR